MNHNKKRNADASIKMRFFSRSRGLAVKNPQYFLHEKYRLQNPGQPV
jgi:hypothetical protein